MARSWPGDVAPQPVEPHDRRPPDELEDVRVLAGGHRAPNLRAASAEHVPGYGEVEWIHERSSCLVVEEARLERNASGLVPATEGWFVVNVAEASWFDHDLFGASCEFESSKAEFSELGIRICVLQPGQPNGLYHGEETQEDFLVLSGECLLLVEGEERRLRAWDFFHCPSMTEHIFVGAGDGPCVLLMTGTRRPGRPIFYPSPSWRCATAPASRSRRRAREKRTRRLRRSASSGRLSWDRLPWA